MNIKIDLNVNLPDTVVNALALMLGNASVPAAVKTAKPAPAAAAAPAAAEQPAQPEQPAAAVNVTDEMIIAAADTAVVKVGSNPKIVKDAIAARFQKDDGSPATLKTVTGAQRAKMYAYLVALGQTGDVNAVV